MKSVLLSIKPKWVAKILNDEKTIEVRKKFPKDYKGWVYIYCTKGYDKDTPIIMWEKPNKFGKVVARFYCDNVEEITRFPLHFKDYNLYRTSTIDFEDLEKQSCLTKYEFTEYLQESNGYAIHISQLEIFDKPKELSEFYRASCKGCFAKNTNYCDEKYCRITKAPQNYCYVEI